MITTFLHHQAYQWNSHRIDLCIPEPGYIQRLYKGQKSANPQTPFPYWTQVWPAALAMAEFIATNPAYVKGKKVVELAAGLGLPSLLAAQWAHKVISSDYLPDAVEVMKQSVAKNGLHNVSCQVLDWNALPADLAADVLILSDINYDPSQFDVLHTVITGFLERGTTILLSTPQRLMAKPFIEQVSSLCQTKREILVSFHEQEVPVTILVMKKG